MIINNNNHSVYKLYYHLVLCVKYRKEIINNQISEKLKDIFIKIGSKYSVYLIEFNHDKHHVHVLFEASPRTNLENLIRDYKSSSSRQIKIDFPSITRYLYKSGFWSRSYFIITSGGAPLEVLKSYIQNQGRR